MPKALKMYAKFLIEILNDREGGQDLLSRAKEATNIKQNFYDVNNMNDDMNDIGSMSTNGTPCIYVTGDNDKIGMVTQVNSGASRIFGYTANEMKNHNVEKLMPEMYAKNHSKILDDALAKGPENIPNKERLVFARHKSSYVFPVWLQLKMVQTVQNGIQFVALFKIDKKLISTHIAYVLINKEKRIQGISSSCMKLMNLDAQKMRRLASSGIDIKKLAPNLFDNDDY
jgi:PAS domain S-box-containing protein